MEENFEKEFEKEVSKIDTNELIEKYKQIQEFVDYLGKEKNNI